MADKTVWFLLPIIVGGLIVRCATKGKIEIDDLNSAVATIRTLSRV